MEAEGKYEKLVAELEEEHERAEAWKTCALRLMAKMDAPK